jgi:4-oxalocrotonate tautomerase
MPNITVQMFAGRDVEKKRALVSALTRATVEALGCKPEAVNIILQDVEKSDWAQAGRLHSDAAADEKR